MQLRTYKQRVNTTAKLFKPLWKAKLAGVLKQTSWQDHGFGACTAFIQWDTSSQWLMLYWLFDTWQHSITCQLYAQAESVWFIWHKRLFLSDLVLLWSPPFFAFLVLKRNKLCISEHGNELHFRWTACLNFWEFLWKDYFFLDTPLNKYKKDFWMCMK